LRSAGTECPGRARKFSQATPGKDCVKELVISFTCKQLEGE